MLKLFFSKTSEDWVFFETEIDSLWYEDYFSVNISYFFFAIDTLQMFNNRRTEWIFKFKYLTTLT